MYIPNGTPNAAADENALSTIPMAPARFPIEKLSPTVDKISAFRIPPKIPVNILAISNKKKLFASPHAKVPTIKPKYAVRTAFLLGNLSIKKEDNKTAMPALIVYEATKNPNSLAVILKIFISCGPNGIITIKSMICVNLAPASAASKYFSFLL